MRQRVLLAVLGAAAAALAASPAFLLFFRAWPELVVAPYFIARGQVLYQDIYLPYTPLLFLFAGLMGKCFGFSAGVLRAIPACAMAASGALLVLGTRPNHRPRLAGPLVGLLCAAPLYVLWIVYAESNALWFDPFVGPFLLGSVLLLERSVRRREQWPIAAGGLLLGLAILVKQTAAWPAAGALAWMIAGSQRRSLRSLALLVGGIVVPYATFVALWGLWYRTWAHVRWTFLIPGFSGAARAYVNMPDSADLLECVPLYLSLAALPLLARSLNTRFHRSSPLACVAVGTLGMALPRWGLLHLGGALGLFSLAAARGVLTGWTTLRRRRTNSPRKTELLALSVGLALLLTHVTVAIIGAGSIGFDLIGGRTYYWDDVRTRKYAEVVRKRVPPGGRFLLFNTPNETLYALTSTNTLGDRYANPSEWSWLGEDHVGDRLVEDLRSSPCALILFQEPDPIESSGLLDTSLYHFIREETHEIERVDDHTSWRSVGQAPPP